jgi:hypothetical protein
MAASFIDSMSEEGDGIREEMEYVARSVCGTAYMGESHLIRTRYPS